MKNPLIKKQPNNLYRLRDFILTALAWLGFTYLFITGFVAVLQKKPPAGINVRFSFLWATLDTLSIYFIVGIINAAILIGWAFYNQKKRKIERRSFISELDDQSIATSFNISNSTIDILRGHTIVTVSNNKDGDIHAVQAGHHKKAVKK